MRTYCITLDVTVPADNWREAVNIADDVAEETARFVRPQGHVTVRVIKPTDSQRTREET